jgi:hypothetical protein
MDGNLIFLSFESSVKDFPRVQIFFFSGMRMVLGEGLCTPL